jgi:cell wall-associated NlpC family hydrolase
MTPRSQVIAEAETWLRTPYHHMGRIKGGGTDCLMLLAEVFASAGVIPRVEVPFYPPDWHLHRDADGISRGSCATRERLRPSPEPGDVAVFKFGRCFSHGTIIISWPRLIHAWWDAGVVYADAGQPPLLGRPVRFFDPYLTPTA